MENEQLSPRPWPPVFSLKKHPRAKYIRFKASIRRGLELVVPPRFNVKNIPQVLEQNRAWIERMLNELESRRQPLDLALPQSLELRAMNALWRLEYLPSQSRLKILTRPQQELVIMGDLEAKAACKLKLVQWIKGQAKLYLLAQLQLISQQTGLAYKTATVRSQSSRWGSCSSKKVINLNYKLLFLPPELMRHVMIHELSHTIHFNHSEQFWQLVARHDANWKEHRRSLRKADSYVPQWVL